MSVLQYIHYFVVPSYHHTAVPLYACKSGFTKSKGRLCLSYLDFPKRSNNWPYLLIKKKRSLKLDYNFAFILKEGPAHYFIELCNMP